MEVEEINQKKLFVDKKLMEEMGSGVASGLLLTNIVFYFIILATSTVLYTKGVFNINTVEEAARALKPLAGDYAYLLFSLGVIGTGALAIPVLAGSLSYMIAETFNWKEGLDNTFLQAQGFYLTMMFSLIVGLVIQFLGISPVKILFYTAVLYGLVSPFLIGIILLICNNEKIMGPYKNTFMPNFFGILTLTIMGISGFLLIYYSFRK
jgi:Mn2+/Fe2+ NRAMP family transporter